VYCVDITAVHLPWHVYMTCHMLSTAAQPFPRIVVPAQINYAVWEVVWLAYVRQLSPSLNVSSLFIPIIARSGNFRFCTQLAIVAKLHLRLFSGYCALKRIWVTSLNFLGGDVIGHVTIWYPYTISYWWSFGSKIFNVECEQWLAIKQTASV